MKTLHTLIAIALLNLMIVVGMVLVLPKTPDTKQPAIIAPAPVSTPLATPTPTRKPATSKPVSATAKPQPVTAATSTTPKPAPAATPVPSNRCIIKIDGVSYDVSDFRNLHSGGNIFQCGTDMSAIFWGQHGASMLSRMQQYKI